MDGRPFLSSPLAYVVSVVGLGFELAVVPPLAGEGHSLREGLLQSVPEAESSQRRSGRQDS